MKRCTDGQRAVQRGGAGEPVWGIRESPWPRWPSRRLCNYKGAGQRSEGTASQAGARGTREGLEAFNNRRGDPQGVWLYWWEKNKAGPHGLTGSQTHPEAGVDVYRGEESLEEKARGFSGTWVS